MNDGLIAMVYDPQQTGDGVAFLRVQVATADGQVAVARVDLQFG